MRIDAEFVVAAGDQLVGIDLMAGVPDQPVAAKVERGVQRQAQLDDAQVRGKMGRAVAEQIAQRLAHLAGQLFQLVERQSFQIGGDSIVGSSFSIQ